MFETGVVRASDVNRSVRAGGKVEISSRLYHFQYKKKITLNYTKSVASGFFPKGLKNEFKTAVVNEPSVFDPSEVLLYMGKNRPCLSRNMPLS